MLLIGLVSVIAGWRAARSEHYAREYREIAKNATIARAQQIEQTWRALPYTNAPLDAVGDQFLAAINWSSLRLSEVQESKLRTRLRQLFRYLTEPRFQDYYRLKTDGFHYQFEPNQRTRRVMAEAAERKELDGPRSDVETVKLVWNIIHRKSGETVLPQISAVCLQSVASTISHTNSGFSLLNGKVAKGFTVAVEALEPGFVYPIGEQPVPGVVSEGLFYEFSFFAKANGKDNAGPMHISLYWVEQDQNWALNRLISDQWLGFETLF